MGLIRYSCDHILGHHEPIHVKFGVWRFFIMLYRNMVMKLLKCKKKIFDDVTLRYSIPSLHLVYVEWTNNHHQNLIETLLFLPSDSISKPTVQYAVKVQRSLAPLSRFRGSHITTAHEQECCRFQSYAKSVPSPMKFTSEIYKAWTTFLRSTTTEALWRMTLTAY